MSVRNEWIERYACAGDLQAIRERSRRNAIPLQGLESMSIGIACDAILAELREIFVPTASCCRIISEVLQSALSHAESHYPDRKSFLANAYKADLVFDPQVPIFLTGLAGTGKTQLAKAILRLLGPDRDIHVGHGHGNFPLVAASRIAVEGRLTLASVLRRLTDPSFSGEHGALCGRGLDQNSTKWQYIIGACLIILDELQFLTQSDKANTVIAKTILRMTFVGPPLLVIGNFSLGHRLLTRRHEERQRLLARPCVLLPDPPASPDWEEVLSEFQKALPDVFAFSFVLRRQQLWTYCAGLKRVLVHLLVLAYRRTRVSGRHVVNWLDIESAYCSSTFSVMRRDVESMIGQAIDGTKLSKDLQCPFDIPKAELESYPESLRECRGRALSEAVGRSVLNANETRNLHALREHLDEGRPSPVVNSKNQGAGRSARITADDLINNGRKYRGSK